MIGRKEYAFTIGYSGNTAIVDGSLKQRFKSLTPQALAKAGQFKAALCAALYDRSEEGLRQVLEEFNRRTPRPLRSVDELKRIFGVFDVPPGVGKIIQV